VQIVARMYPAQALPRRSNTHSSLWDPPTCAGVGVPAWWSGTWGRRLGLGTTKLKTGACST